MYLKPKVTVVTVCFQAADVLAQTIESVLAQTYSEIEYLIIDGNSTDSTREIVAKYSDRIALFISEPDKGIYDAMNKGIRLAQGEYINFMNAGDTFFEATTVEKAIRLAPPQADMIVGNVCVLNQTYTEIHAIEDLSTPWRKLKFCHQSLFLRTRLAKEQPFSGKYVTSDFEQVYAILQKHPQTLIFDTKQTIANFRNDGFNTHNKRKVRWECYQIVSKHDKSIATQLYFFKLITWTYIVEGLRQLVGQKTFEKLFAYKQKIAPNKRKVIQF
jgi:glycosyltransferase involved in cell wall biosynthesis